MDAPIYSPSTERLYRRLPDVYRDSDERNGFLLKHFIASVVDIQGEVDLLIARMLYRPPRERELYRKHAQPNTTYVHEGRPVDAPELSATSDLVDPRAADPEWLMWLGQLIGVRVTPGTPVYEARTMIEYAASGYRAGSKSAIENAVKSVLSGSQYALAMPMTKTDANDNLLSSDVWDLTILTRADESPTERVILDLLNRPTVKPAGVRFFHRYYSASWDKLEAVLPFWDSWDDRYWDQIEQVGLKHVPVEGNLVTNPSFEANTTGWASTGAATMSRVSGGVDGEGQLRYEHTGTGQKVLTSPVATATLGASVVHGIGVSYQSSQPFKLEVVAGANVVTFNIPASLVMTRFTASFAPSAAMASARVRLTFDTGTTNDYALLDAFALKRI